MIDLLKYVAGLNQMDIKEIEVMPDHGHLWSRAYSFDSFHCIELI